MTGQQPIPADGESPESGDGSTRVAEYRPERIRERFFSDGVTDAAEQHGWRTFHLRDRDSVHIVRGRGFPDLVMFRKNPETGDTELLAAELKRDYESTTTPEQDEWLEALDQHIPAYTWRPEEWEEIDKVLQDGPASHPGTWQPTTRRTLSPIPANFGSIVTNIIESIESLEMTTGEKADLRRMTISDPDCPVFWKLVNQRGMPGNMEIEKWALITHGIALMAHGAGLAHRPRIAVGQALYQGGGNRVPFYSEDRLATLLSARGSTLHRSLARVFRMLSNEGCAFNWREMAWFILNDGNKDDEEADKSRIEIARAYYRAMQRSTQQSDTQGDSS